MTITYSGKSKPSAVAIQQQLGCQLNRGYHGDINWGRNIANTKLNPDISNVTNKKKMRQLFAEHGVPTPQMYTVEQLDRMVQVINGRRERFEAISTVIGRPDRHTQGRGFWKCRSMVDVRKALRGTRRKRAATHFMEYVESDREYRVHIFQGKSIRISEKVYTDETRKKYTTGKPGDIKLRKVREAAKAAVEAVGLDFGAVDILARGDDNDQVFVLEVNAAPGLGGSMPKLYADTFNNWYEEQ